MKDLEVIRDAVPGHCGASPNRDTFIYELLRAYGFPKASVTRLETGDYNRAKVEGEILWKNESVSPRPPMVSSSRLLRKPPTRGTCQSKPRFLVVTDFETLVAQDLRQAIPLIRVRGSPERYEFFLPWAGIERAQVFHENPADIKAAERWRCSTTRY